MHKTRLSLLLLATLAGCVGNRTPLLNPPAGKPDARLKAFDAGVDRQADARLPEAPDRAPDLNLDRSGPDSSADRPGDLPVPDTRPPSPDLLPDRPADRPAETRWFDTRPISPDLAPDRGDLPPDRPQDAPGSDVPGRDLPPFEGLGLDRAPDREPDGPGVADTAVDAAGPDSGPDASPSDTMAACVPGTPYPLVLGHDQRLYRFDPNDVSLTGIADVSCGDADLNSMTASPLGAAYISNLGGQLCRLDVRTFETTLTSFDTNLIGNVAYGMALLSDSSPRGQSLYIAINNNSGSASAELKVVNLASYTYGDIGPIDPVVPRTELTAGPGNTLYALHPSRPSSLLHLDPQTANAVGVVTLPDSASGSFALVYWEDSFYLFMEDGTDSSLNDVYRYRMTDGQTTMVGTLPVQIIGAGVALCQ